MSEKFEVSDNGVLSEHRVRDSIADAVQLHQLFMLTKPNLNLKPQPEVWLLNRP